MRKFFKFRLKFCKNAGIKKMRLQKRFHLISLANYDDKGLFELFGVTETTKADR